MSCRCKACIGPPFGCSPGARPIPISRSWRNPGPAFPNRCMSGEGWRCVDASSRDAAPTLEHSKREAIYIHYVRLCGELTKNKKWIQFKRLLPAAPKSRPLAHGRRCSLYALHNSHSTHHTVLYLFPCTFPFYLAPSILSKNTPTHPYITSEFSIYSFFNFYYILYTTFSPINVKKHVKNFNYAMQSVHVGSNTILHEIFTVIFIFSLCLSNVSIAFHYNL